MHLASGCDKLARKQYVIRHDNVGRRNYKNLQKNTTYIFIFIYIFISSMQTSVHGLATMLCRLEFKFE